MLLCVEVNLGDLTVTATGLCVKSNISPFPCKKLNPRMTGATRVLTTTNSCKTFNSPNCIEALTCCRMGSLSPDAVTN